jgi:hypothetical protein
VMNKSRQVMLRKEECAGKNMQHNDAVSMDVLKELNKEDYASSMESKAQAMQL